jgi:hypothetical protein
MDTPPGWGLEHRASNPVSLKNLTAIETSTSVKLLRPYVPVGTKRTSKCLRTGYSREHGIYERGSNRRQDKFHNVELEDEMKEACSTHERERER